MAGRGRGGGGRGRGRGSMSFNVEQLGFTAGEALPGPVLQPPPLYPPLERRPVPLKSGSEVEYLLALKRDFVEILKYSPSYVLPTAKKKDIEHYSDYKNVETPSRNGTIIYDWKRFPLELRPQVSKKPSKKRPQSNAETKEKPSKIKNSLKRAKKSEDVTNKLEELEKMEEQGDVEEKNEENKDEKEGEQQEEEVEDEEDQDEEMDDGTDYVNNYFDNGESYLDEEDDNLDDGPVY